MELSRILLSVVGMVLVAGIIAWGIYWAYRVKQLLYEERRLMIEKGMTPPPILSGTMSWPQVKHHEQLLRYEERRLRIEKGLDVPPDEKKPMTREDFLMRGTVMLFLGLGLGLGYVVARRSGLRVYGDEQAWLFALAVSSAIVGLSGLGHLVYYRMAKDRKAPVSDRGA
jgi:hypothetical protein